MCPGCRTSHLERVYLPRLTPTVANNGTLLSTEREGVVDVSECSSCERRPDPNDEDNLYNTRLLAEEEFPTTRLPPRELYALQ